MQINETLLFKAVTCYIPPRISSKSALRPLSAQLTLTLYITEFLFLVHFKIINGIQRANRRILYALL
jgi:hypothetical protein